MPTLTNRFEKCPVCGGYVRVTLTYSWVELMGEAFEIIGCGNPWHYMEHDAEEHDGESKYHGLDEEPTPSQEFLDHLARTRGFD